MKTAGLALAVASAGREGHAGGRFEMAEKAQLVPEAEAYLDRHRG